MRKIVRFLLLRPILWLANRFSSAPDRERIFEALSDLKERLEKDPGKKGFIIPFDITANKFILFSDQHKGRKNGADDFALAEKNYVSALKYYNDQGYHFISLGDAEELWENTLIQVKKQNTASFNVEKQFALRNAFTKIFGNHDLDWEINPLAAVDLKELYGTQVEVLEGIILQATIEKKSLTIFCTHGHQGDLQSDGNLFSKFFVSKIWAPLQAYLRINPNTPAYDATLKTEHNLLMYEWSSQQKGLLLITGHTHQPVFESLTHLERLQRQDAVKQSRHEPFERTYSFPTPSLEFFQKIRPSYFNTGCCCYDDGDITGIEIADGCIRLVKWEKKDGDSLRTLLEQINLVEVARKVR